MSSPKQLLIQAGTLLCLEHRDGVSTEPSKDLITQVLNALPIPESTVDVDHGRQTFLELRKCISWLVNLSNVEFPQDGEIKQQISIACREETYLTQAFQQGVDEEYSDIKGVFKRIQSLRSRLKEFLNEQQIVALLKEASQNLIFKKDPTRNAFDISRELSEKLEPLVNSRSKIKHPSLTGELDFGDIEDLGDFFKQAEANLSPEGALKPGWQGLARMLGTVGAFRRGEFVSVAAMQHNFKSGWMILMLVHFCLFNKPVLRDPTRIPLIVFYSFENTISENLLQLYVYIKENETGEAVITSEIDIKEASRYVKERLEANGWKVKMISFNPTDFTYRDFIAELDHYYAEGYEIVAILADYLNKISKAGLEAKTAGEDIRQLFRVMRNWTTPRGILFMTPHQISTEANQLLRENVEDFVKKVANKNYYDGSKRLSQEPDLELFLHKVIVNGVAYLTIARGKHRYTVTPEKFLYFVLKFSEVGTIPWDIDKEDTTLSHPGGGAVGSEDEVPWWNDM